MKVERGWFNLSEASKYVGMNPGILRRAIAKGELDAYVKPATYENDGKNMYMKISRDDLDAWVRSLPKVNFGSVVL